MMEHVSMHGDTAPPLSSSSPDSIGGSPEDDRCGKAVGTDRGAPLRRMSAPSRRRPL